MTSNGLGEEWTVEWATPNPSNNGYFENLVLDSEQRREYGDELVWALCVDGEKLREWGIDPREPFAWKIGNGEVEVKQISRQMLEDIAKSNRFDAHYAKSLVRTRANRKAREFK